MSGRSSPPSSGPAPTRRTGTDDLQRRSVRGGGARLLAQLFQTVLAVGTGIALARLLTPVDFGVFAMAFTLVGFVTWFRDFGLPLALTQRPDLTGAAALRVFKAGLWLTAGLVAFVVLMAPLAAAFYDEPRVRSVVFAMAVGILGLGFAIVPEGLLMRRMRFEALAMIETAAVVIGAALAIAAAILGAGYWALVYQFLALTLVKSVGVWLVSDWRLGRSIESGGGAEDASYGGSADPDETRGLLAYARHLTVARIIRYVGLNADRILIGRVYGSSAIGLYDNAMRWSQYPARQVLLPLQNVIVSTLSKVQGDLGRYRSAFRRGTFPVFSVIVPALAYLAIDARAVVLALLGDQWIEAVPLFRLLALGAVAQTLQKAASWLYLSEGRTDRLMRWNTFAAAVQLVAIAIGLWWGVEGVALALAAASWLLVAPNIWYCTRWSPLDAGDFLPMMWRPLAAAAVSAGLAILLWPDMLADRSASGGELAAVLTRLPIFLTFYLAFWIGLPGGRAALRDARDLLALLTAGKGAGSDGRAKPRPPEARPDR